ncbi:EAL domain-containing protein [Alicyclobacillus acidocaldarius]|uniref:Diguanylate phosphodiesterase n=1 Tax=Alicyclobacillus acidocaldarius subsp. acidocaldarius (strain ATCC 27009 / DSM 446 / BCRC 14685 / JCM 5260 / KCTC 1825 / NBRC 15652 / NCIMB 11725 / NRRL B-14509 / 104-IA) TaxID=521098 RepID=C8WYI0_ALIAD|nr:diguanylate phosphodiesterase [Alicyclobacillus acidocaldarius subsp. acidocaldarius DSM 446]
MLRTNVLEFVYQPIVDHARGEVCAHEALSRPRFRGHGISPDVWFRAAVACNRALEVDQLVVSLSVQSMQFAWMKAPSTLLFVNVTPSSLMETVFVEQLERVFQAGLCRPEQLVLEIVEYVSYDVTRLFPMIQFIRSLGVQIALDDVGTGSSTLTAVLTLEPDWVKVDRTWIEGISRTPAKQRSLSQLVQMMGSGDRIIAEGVETSEDLRTVRGLGVPMSQGYYWSPPLSVDQIQGVIQEIERRRREFVKLAEERSWSDPMVISKSREIDRLVTLYHRWGAETADA